MNWIFHLCSQNIILLQFGFLYIFGDIPDTLWVSWLVAQGGQSSPTRHRRSIGWSSMHCEHTSCCPAEQGNPGSSTQGGFCREWKIITS